jgi:uridine kinase
VTRDLERSPIDGVERSPIAGVERSLIAIDGIDGSGKSRFARSLAAGCEAEGEPEVFVFRVDDFRRPLSVPPGADEAAHYYDSYYDFGLLDACLGAFLAGQPGVTVPRFDPAREVVDGEQRLDFGRARLALCEGVFVLRAPTTAAAPLIVLEVGEAEARRRILERDLGRGRARDVVEHRMNNRYFPAQRLYRAACDPLRRADVLIDNARWDHPRVLRRSPRPMPRLVEKVLSALLPS